MQLLPSPASPPKKNINPINCAYPLSPRRHIPSMPGPTRSSTAWRRLVLELGLELGLGLRLGVERVRGGLPRYIRPQAHYTLAFIQHHEPCLIPHPLPPYTHIHSLYPLQDSELILAAMTRYFPAPGTADLYCNSPAEYTRITESVILPPGLVAALDTGRLDLDPVPSPSPEPSPDPGFNPNLALSLALALNLALTLALTLT